jgi:hypothetical protein
MSRIGSAVPPTVKATGADAGRVLRGACRNNRGLRLRVAQAQQRGKDGAITGGFVILDIGDNKHTESLAALLHRPTDAAEVLAAIRCRHAGCVHIVNTNLLVLEPATTPGHEQGTTEAVRPPRRA